jgi:hypothetical protein
MQARDETLSPIVAGETIEGCVTISTEDEGQWLNVCLPNSGVRYLPLNIRGQIAFEPVLPTRTVEINAGEFNAIEPQVELRLQNDGRAVVLSSKFVGQERFLTNLMPGPVDACRAINFLDFNLRRMLPLWQDAFVGARSSPRAYWLNSTQAELRKLVMPLIAFEERSNTRDRSSGNTADALQFAAVVNWELKAAVVYERNTTGALNNYLQKIYAGSATDDVVEFLVIGCFTHGIDNYATEVDPALGLAENRHNARTLKTLIHSEKNGIISRSKVHSKCTSFIFSPNLATNVFTLQVLLLLLGIAHPDESLALVLSGFNDLMGGDAESSYVANDSCTAIRSEPGSKAFSLVTLTGTSEKARAWDKTILNGVYRSDNFMPFLRIEAKLRALTTVFLEHLGVVLKTGVSGSSAVQPQRDENTTQRPKKNQRNENQNPVFLVLIC